MSKHCSGMLRETYGAFPTLTFPFMIPFHLASNVPNACVHFFRRSCVGYLDIVVYILNVKFTPLVI